MSRKASNATARPFGPGGFSPIETVGAISVIGLLAVAVLPRAFGLVNDARLNRATQSYLFAKAAAVKCLEERTAQGKTNFLSDADAAVHWDSLVLVPGGYLQGPFSTSLSARARLSISTCAAVMTVPRADNTAYSLAGHSPAAPNSIADGTWVAEAILEGVDLADARELNRRIDGEDPVVGETATGTDLGGRIKYEFGTSKTGFVRIYLAHR